MLGEWGNLDYLNIQRMRTTNKIGKVTIGKLCEENYSEKISDKRDDNILDIA